jgi:hypothetical protein
MLASLTLTAMGVLALAAASSAAPHLQSARFRATLSATENISWNLNASDSCGSQTGSGSLKVAFHQARRLTLIFSRQIGGSHLLMVRLAPKAGDIPIKGEMTQTGKVNYTTDPRCATNGRPEGPPMAPPQPDCGTKTFKGAIRLTWSTPELYPTLPEETPPLVPALWLDEPYTSTRFAVCPYYGPLLIFRLIHTGLKESKIFGPKPKLKLHAETKQVRQYPGPDAARGVRSVTSVEWTMKLTRLH